MGTLGGSGKRGEGKEVRDEEALEVSHVMAGDTMSSEIGPLSCLITDPF